VRKLSVQHQKAVSRLEFAPKLKEIEVTDIKKGHGVFTPKPDKRASFAGVERGIEESRLRAGQGRHYGIRNTFAPNAMGFAWAMSNA